METKGEVLLHGRQTDCSPLVLLGHLCLGRPVEEVHIDVSTNRPPCDVGGLKQSLHTVSVAEVDTVTVGNVIRIRASISREQGKVAGVRVNLVVSGIKVEGMGT